MNVGLSSLAVLKAWLLAPSLVSGTDYDAQITALGLGVAASLETFCNRKFARVTDDLFETTADRQRLVVLRYPIETISKIEIRDDLSIGWVDQGTVNDVLFNLREAAGLLEFAGYLGASFSRIRITYTGGYWFDTTEDASGTLPSGAAALPGDLKLAWLTQCEFLWGQRDKLGINIAEKPTPSPALAQVELLPAVKQMIRTYVRYAST